MREELKQAVWHCYGLSERDIDNLIGICAGFAQSREDEMKRVEEQIRAENPVDAEDILDDTLYYKGLDIFYLWEFCIVRLIGIFEGVIEIHFLPRGKYTGFGHRVRSLKAQGYDFCDELSILEWVQLRNNLVHSPPEAYRPAMIGRSDAEECAMLLKTSLSDLFRQKRSDHG